MSVLEHLIIVLLTVLVVAALIGTIKFDMERTAPSTPRLHGMRYSSRPQGTAALILGGGSAVGRKVNKGCGFSLCWVLHGRKPPSVGTLSDKHDEERVDYVADADYLAIMVVVIVALAMVAVAWLHVWR